MKNLIYIIVFFMSGVIFSQTYRNNYATKLFLTTDPLIGRYEIVAPPNLTTTYTFKLPPTVGNNGEILMSLGDGSYTWTDPSITNVSPGGNNSNIQFSSNQSFSGSDFLTWNNSTNRLFIGTNLGTSNVNVKQWVASGDENNAGFLSLHTGNSSFRSNFSTNSTMTESITLTLPATDGTAGQFLVTDGSGNLYWSSASVGGSGATFNCDQGQGTGGGTGNVALENDTFIGGGNGNTIPDDGSLSSVIGGGSLNYISNSENSGIISGSSNTLTNSKNSVICSGNSNKIDQAEEAGIGAGRYNLIDDEIDSSNDSDRSVIGSGEYNYLSSSEGIILTGYSNSISADNRKNNFIGSGQENFISNTGESGISTGKGNTISNQYSFTVGGTNNNVSGNYSSIVGGANNILSGDYSVILGGSSNTVSGQYSMAFGIESKANGNYSVAIGYNANALNEGSFVLADGNSQSLSSSSNNQMTMRFTGGYRFYTNSALTTGMTYAPGNASWAAVSDKNLKTNILDIDYKSFLDKISDLSITSWSYIFSENNVRNYGPMAQDFYQLFGKDDLGTFGNEKEIISNHVTFVGLAALKGLILEYENTNQKIVVLNNEQQKILEEIIILENEINKIHNMIGDAK